MRDGVVLPLVQADGHGCLPKEGSVLGQSLKLGHLGELQTHKGGMWLLLVSSVAVTKYHRLVT